MRCSLRLIALVTFCTTLILPVSAQSTPGPPNWQDMGGSVYLEKARAARPTAESESSTPKTDLQTAPPIAAVIPPAKLKSNIVPASHSVTTPQNNDSTSRRLAPPSSRLSNEKLSSAGGQTEVGPRRLVNFGIPTESMYTIITSMTIVIGAFLIFVWMLRRSGRGKAGRRGILPAEAVSVLGRVPLTGRQVAELLRVGNKLVLIALTPTGAETLTEVTDPAEVDRLMGLCQQHDRHSTTKAFEQVFQQLTREPGGGGFLGADMLPTSLSPVAAAYRSHRG